MSVRAGEITPKVTFVVLALLNLIKKLPSMLCDQFVANVS